MPAYDSVNYHPPAPLALVKVCSPTSGDFVEHVPMLLDTGADVTLLPRGRVAQLVDLNQSLPQFELVGFDGSKSSSPTVQLEVEFLGKTFRGQFLVVDEPHGILGRNILNALSLLMNGPARNWSEV